MNTYNRGLIKGIVLLLAALLLLSIFGVDFTRVFTNEAVRANFRIVANAAGYVWDRFLAAPLQSVWDALLRQLLNFIRSQLEERLSLYKTPFGRIAFYPVTQE